MSSAIARRRVAFIERSPAASFIATDRAALELTFDVDVVRYDQRPTLRYVLDAVRLAWRDDATYAFFASEHALLPALVAGLRGRAFVLAPAGYDFANVPEHRYGLAARRRGWLPKLLGRLANPIVCCSSAARDELLALVPSAAQRAIVAHLGADPDEWADAAVPRDPARVVTLGYITKESWSRKGIDRFVAAAAADPSREYVLAGRIGDEVRSQLDEPLPPNLVLTGFVDHEAQRRLFQSAGIYTQLSWHESFGMALLEAMLCGCVPVITDLPSLREVAGSWAEVSHGRQDDVAAITRASGRQVDRDELRREVATRYLASKRQEAVRAAVAAAITRRAPVNPAR